VRDLQEGTGAIEERARYELGMIKGDEIFVQIVSPNTLSRMNAAPPQPQPADPAARTGTATAARNGAAPAR
jgi:cell division protein FtsB